jgi:cytochrome P450
VPRELPSASLVDVAQFNRLVVVPNALQGLFRRRPAAVALAVKADVDGAAVRLLAGMRDRYEGGPVWIRLMRDRALLLLSVEDVRRVLEGSPEPFAADPPAKRKGMSHFQPHALTISRDGLWEERRRFTETVLDTPEPVHRLGDRFVAVAREETRGLLAASQGRLDWEAWHAAFRRMVRRIVLGDAAAGDEEVTNLLARLMSEANNLPGERSEHFGPFVERLRSYVEAQEPGSLASLIPHAPQTPATAATGQVPHWLFASADTLPANALRALALIVSHAPQHEEVRRELAADGAGDGVDAAALADLSYLRACLMDAMRLYPTTPILSRETVADVDFDGARLPAGTQLLWVNLFHHRDRRNVPNADRFSPEAWTEGDAWSDWSFNHFSHGPQGCPGTYLALLLGTAVLAETLAAPGLRLEQPRIEPGRPLPHMLDVFRVRVAYSARS